MNKLTKTVGALALIVGVMPTPALADYYREGGVKSTTCIKKIYREEYVPGSASNPGRVRSWYERKEVPCKGHRHAHGSARRTHHHHYPVWIEPRGHGRKYHRNHMHSGGTIHGNAKVDDNSCIEGSVIGGIAGGAAGGTLATKKNWIWSIPLGVIGGAMVGCQVDGG